MRLVVAVRLAVVVLGVGGAGGARAQNPKTDEERTLYMLGHRLGQGLTELELDAREMELVKRGLADAATGAVPAVPGELSQQKLNEVLTTRAVRRQERVRQAGVKALAALAAEKGAVKLPSGVVVRTETAGAGATPTVASAVRVHYRGTLADGTEFDSSHARGEPARFPLNAVIPCWTEGLQQLKPGAKARLGCPADKAYGARGSPPKIPPNMPLFFEVELLAVE
jgi:FKBP-type peptidyl-prolyl cis-trans isomerase FkpA